MHRAAPHCCPAGEYGELLTGPESGKLLEGEEPLGGGSGVSEADVVGLLEAVVQVRGGNCCAVFVIEW